MSRVKHNKGCELGDNWKECPACVDHHNSLCTPKYVMPMPVIPESIAESDDYLTHMLRKDLKRLRDITKDCREDMHEPDEQEIRVKVKGNHLDNAMGDDPASNCGEYTIGINNGLTGELEWFNLATLIAIARKAKV